MYCPAANARESPDDTWRSTICIEPGLRPRTKAVVSSTTLHRSKELIVGLRVLELGEHELYRSNVVHLMQ